MIVAPKVPTRIGGTTVVPSGFRIEILAPQHDVFPIVTLLRRRLTRCVAVPLNVSGTYTILVGTFGATITATLPVTGTYSVGVDPQGAYTGGITLNLSPL